MGFISILEDKKSLFAHVVKDVLLYYSRAEEAGAGRADFNLLAVSGK